LANVRLSSSATRRAASKAHEYVSIERFEAAGLEVELLVAGCDLSPRRLRRGRRGVLVCAEPYANLSDGADKIDRSGDGATVADDDVALALLLAAALTEESLWVLEAHVREQPYQARVILPVYLTEDDESSRTGVSLRVEPRGADAALPVGIIFGGDSSTAGVPATEAEAMLREEVARYDAYLRGEVLLAVITDDLGTTLRRIVADDGTSRRCDAKPSAPPTAAPERSARHPRPADGA
jgi:hypothetical protein